MREYLSYWELEESAFQGRLDYDDIYIPEHWQNRIDRVLLFAEKAPSLMTLISHPGHCKSTMAHWFYKSLSPDTHEVLLLSLYQEEFESGWLLPKLAKFLGVHRSENQEMLSDISDSIEAIDLEGRILTVIIDEAHKIKSAKAMEEVHTLISMQSLINFGINFILIGNPSMSDVVSQSPEFQNRLSLSCELEELEMKDIESYITHRLNKHGLNSNIVLPDAYSLIQEHSQGLFSRLNGLLENSLIEAFLRKEKTINSKTIEQAAQFLPSMTVGYIRKRENRTASHTEQAVRQKDKPKPSRRNKETAKTKPVEISSLFYKSDKK